MSMAAPELSLHSQSSHQHPPTAAPPPKSEAPVRAANSAGADYGDTGTGHAKYKTDAVTPQQPFSGLVGVQDFDDLLRRSTPAELLVRVRLHKKYLPHVALPANLQRALGASWRCA